MNDSVHIIDHLDEISFNHLISIQREGTNNFDFFLEHCDRTRMDEVRFNYCVRKDFDEKGNYSPDPHFELCLTQSSGDPLNRIHFFLRNEDFNGSSLGCRLHVKRHILLAER